MLRSLYSGVSGVKAHQTYLDVVGNNVANVNTAGYKKSNIIFQDLLYQNARGAMAPDADGGRGGIDPMQVGLGVNVGAIETIHTQGNTQYTGNRNDMAISGDGYFVVRNGQDTYYTRAGAAILDGSGKLVMSGSGYEYQGYQMIPDPLNRGEFIKGGTLEGITIPVGQKMEARDTSVVGYRCNLDGRVGAYLPMGVLANNFTATAKLAGQQYPVTMAEGATASSFLTLDIGGQTLTLKQTGVDATNARPQLASETPFVMAGNTYTVAFDSATGDLSLTNLGDPADVWTLNLKQQMDYQTVTISDGTTQHPYLAEFTDLNTVTQPGYKTLRLRGVDYKGDMNTFEYTVKVNGDGTFDIPTPPEDGRTRLGGFGGGAFVSLNPLAGGQGIQLKSSEEIVDSSQVTEKVGISPTIVQKVNLAGKLYDVTLTEGDPDGGFATLKFVDRDNPTNTGTLQMRYAGLNATGALQLTPVSTLALDGHTYTAAYTAGATDGLGNLTLDDPTVVGTEWTYNLGSRIKAETVSLTTQAGALGGTFRGEYDSLGGGDYRYTLLGEGTGTTPGRFLEVNTSNFRQYMGVVPGTERVNIAGTEYDVTPSEGTSSGAFMTLTFRRVSDGLTGSVTFALAGLDGQNRVQMRAAGDLTLPGSASVNYTRSQIAYDPATKKLTFDNGNPAQTFSTETGKYVNFQVVEDNLGNPFLVDFDEAGTTSFAMKTWVPGASFSDPTGMTFAAGTMTPPVAALPLTPGTVSFAVGGTEYRDDGNGAVEQLIAGVWTPVAGSSVDYQTGVVTVPALAGAVTDWSSVIQSAAYTRTGGITFAAGGATVPVEGWPLVPGSVEFTVAGNQYRDDGNTAMEQLIAGVWTAIGGSSINYTTGVIAGLGGGVAGTITSWSSRVQTGAPSSVSVPVTLGNEQTLGSLNQRVANTHQSKLDVYDTQGNAHVLETSWEKLDNGIWRWRSWLPDETGITLTDNTGLIRFTADGKIDQSDLTTFNPVPTIKLAFGQIGASDAEIQLDFSGKSFEKEDIEGVTQYGSVFTTKGYYQDGYAMGILNDYAVGDDGTVTGSYSNGQRQPLYRVALGLFANPQGLIKQGDTVFSESANSGLAQVTDPKTAGAGKILGSTLEMANVDLTDEFTKLIVAQRGFQANARMITTSDQVLEELINLKR